MRQAQEMGSVSHLGSQGTQYRDDYAPEVLETFPNKHQGNDYFVKFNCPECTSLCPITGQPDFASTSPMFRVPKWWRASRSSSIYSASVTTGIFMKTA